MDGTIALRKKDVRRLYKGISKRSLRDGKANFPTYSEIKDAVRNAETRKRSILVKSWKIRRNQIVFAVLLKTTSL